MRSRRSPLIPDLRWASGATWRLGSERGEIGQPDAKGATRLEVVAQEVAPGPASGPAPEVLRFEAFCREELQRTAQSCTPPHGNPRGFILGEQDVASPSKFQHPEREYVVLRRKGAHWSRRHALSQRKNYTLGRNIVIWQRERQYSSREGVALREETTHWSGPNSFFRREKPLRKENT